MQTGYLLIDKPVDWTSHDVVGCIRGTVRAYAREHGSTVKPKNIRVGHAGTLDPFATGLLIVGVGRDATKEIDTFKGMPKEYIATVQLGGTSDTQDLTGVIVPTEHTGQVSKAAIEDTLKKFVGTQLQIPPMYSAKKVGGKKLYELAREGKTIERQPCDIEIFDIELLLPLPMGSKHESERVIEGVSGNDVDNFSIRVSCGPGTYIRTLAHDIGQMLGTGAYCSALRRTKIGAYTVTGTVGPKEVTEDNWQSMLFDR
jgi:tRNA pseudouridine55 synthase